MSVKDDASGFVFTVLNEDIEFSDVVDYLDEIGSDSSPEDVYDTVVQLVADIKAEL